MRQNPHVRICGGPGSATTLVYPTPSCSPEKPDASFLLKLGTDDLQSLLTELFEASHDPSLPDPALLAGWYQMAFHDVTKMRPARFSVLCEITPGRSHPDLHVVPGYKEANIAQPVVRFGRKVILHLPLWKHVVPMSAVCMADDVSIQRDRFTVLKISRRTRRQEAKECAGSRRARCVLRALNVHYRVEMSAEYEVSTSASCDRLEEPCIGDDVPMIASAAVPLCHTGRPEPLLNLGGLRSIRLTRMVIEEHG